MTELPKLPHPAAFEGHLTRAREILASLEPGADFDEKRFGLVEQLDAMARTYDWLATGAAGDEEQDR